MANPLKKLEFFFIFLIIPSTIFFLDSSIIIFLTLYLVSILSLVILYFDKTFLFTSLKKKIDWTFVIIFSVIFFFLGFFYVLLVDKNLLFIFPKTNFKLWLIVIFIYPFLSVIPQELVYRVFFFQRYFPNINRFYFPVFLNLVVFAYGHLVFSNMHAIIITAIVSPIFTYAYLKKSFLTCVILHTLGGQIIFTLGLGKYFF
ncbi:MAG: CPBP family glutamic-type intramembrane protease [Alphaproteobacteria bacterium]|jgi:membrane protease YdiL (CAAX protease family)|tara:strand:+ start:203 stop:805 length:603 start_codon:yes stop_codon:yes gene_type:complete